MSAMVSQITSLMTVNSMVYSGAGQRKHQSSASLAFVRGIHRWPVNSPHKRPVTRRMFSFDDVSMLGSAGLLPLFTRRFHTEIFMRPVSKFSNTCIDDSSVFNSLHAINLVWLLWRNRLSIISVEFITLMSKPIDIRYFVEHLMVTNVSVFPILCWKSNNNLIIFVNNLKGVTVTPNLCGYILGVIRIHFSY